jgi:tetratricopeptide (TPR) repeat protein
MVRQGQVALGQGQYRLGQFEEAAGTFDRVLQESPPSLTVLRGLGLSLARLDRFDQAFKHLRAAHELEEPKDFLTAGYLALCGAKGRPTQPGAKAQNVSWAVRLVSRFQVVGNAEWAGLLNQIFAEARDIDLPLGQEDQVRLCDVLASVDAADPLSAAAYAHLAAAFPDALRPEYAWLYCRAAQQHGSTSALDLELFARTFAAPAEARAFYAQRGWDLEDVEVTYLERCAAQQPGAFPMALGPDYPARGESLLLARSERREQLGDREGAAGCAEVLLKLAPQSTRAHDRLAQLAYRAGDLDRAANLLDDWHRLAPADPLPLARRAAVEQQRGNPAGRADAVRRALDLSQGKARAGLAFLGARLALQAAWPQPAEKGEKGDGHAPDVHENGQLLDKAAGPETSPALHPTLPSTPEMDEAVALLEECLREDPDHEAALWCLAMVRCVRGRHEELAAQAAAMRRLEEQSDQHDARFYFLAAVCYLAAGEYPQMLSAADRAAAISPALASECAYLTGWASLLLGDAASAVRALQQPAQDGAASSSAHARALLGQVQFSQGAYEEAVRSWNALDPCRRRQWELDEPLRATVLVTALQAFQEGRFEQAADRFREAGRLGLRDRRLGPLLTLALIKAGQRLLYASTSL